MKAYADLADLPEDERIRIIIETAKANQGDVIGVAVDDDVAAARYRSKLIAGGLKIISVGPGLTEGTRFIKCTAVVH